MIVSDELSAAKRGRIARSCRQSKLLRDDRVRIAEFRCNGTRSDDSRLDRHARLTVKCKTGNVTGNYLLRRVCFETETGRVNEREIKLCESMEMSSMRM